MKLLVTGANGYVGSSLFEFLKRGHEVVAVSRKDFDLSDFQQTKAFFEGRYFDAVIHCAIRGGSRLAEDSVEVVDNNLKMYYNLLSNREHYRRFVNFGSGAELNNPDSYYGKSKSIISESIKHKTEFYNIMIYAVFGEKELDTRFIKSNVKRYINNQPMQISGDKKMTFFYIEDLCRMVELIVASDSKDLQHLNWASYSRNHSLVEIANMINELGQHRVAINNQNNRQDDYVSPHACLYPTDTVGFEKGLQITYEKLKALS